MDDLINREKLKRKFCGHCEDYGKCEKECFDLRIINSMPAEEKKGKWIKDRLSSTCGGSYGVYRCSECESSYQDIGYGWNYCPNCGARMEEE